MTRSDEHFAFDWIRSEVYETLSQAGEALEAFAAKRDADSMHLCLAAIHQVHGALMMIELTGVSVLSDHMEQLAQCMLDDGIDDIESASELLMQGIIELPELLEEIRRGEPDDVAMVQRLTDNLRDVIGLEPLRADSVALALSVDLSEAALARFREIDGIDKVRRIRSAYQQVLLTVLKGEDVRNSVATLGKVALGLIRVCEGAPIQVLWRAFAEFASALEPESGEGTELGGDVVKLLRRIDSEIRILGRDGEIALQMPVPVGLVEQLVQTALARGRTSEALDELNAALNELGGADDSVSIRSRTALASAAQALREELALVKDQLDLMMRANETAEARISELAAPLQKICSTLSLLGFESSHSIVLEQLQTLDSIGGANAMDDLVVISTQLGQVDENLASHSRARISEVEKITSQAQVVVMHESRAGLEMIKQHIVAFVSSHWDRTALESVPGDLSSLGGALDMIPLPRAAGFLRDCALYVQDELMAGDEPQWCDLDLLADAISGIDYYLERVADNHGTGAEEILDLVERRLGELRGLDCTPGQALAPRLVDKIDPVETVEEEPRRDDGNLEAAEASASEGGAIEPGAEVTERDPEIVGIFVEEAEEVVQNISERLRTWSASMDDQDAAQELRRAFHTLKGSGHRVGATPIGDLSWALENLFNRIMDGTVVATEDVAVLVDSVSEALCQLIDGFKKGIEAKVDVASLMEHADLLASGAQLGSRAQSPALIDVFIDEAAGHLRVLEQAPGVVDGKRMRAWHTLSGSAAMAELGELSIIINPLYECAMAWHDADIPAEVATLLSEGVNLLADSIRALSTAQNLPDPTGIIVEADRLCALARSARDTDEQDTVRRDVLTVEAPEIEAVVAFLERWQAGAQDPSRLEEIRTYLETLHEAADRRPEIAALSSTLLQTYHCLQEGRLNEQALDTLVLGHRLLLEQLDAVAAERTPPSADTVLLVLGALHQDTEIATDIVEAGLPDEKEVTPAGEAESVAGHEADQSDEQDQARVVPLTHVLEEVMAPQGGEETPEPVSEEASEEAGERSRPDARAEETRIPEDADPEILGIFFEEADELLDAVDVNLQNWSTTPQNRLFLENLLRALHTLKGGARLAGLIGLGDETHAFESELISIQEAETPADARLFRKLHERYDELVMQVRALQDQIYVQTVEAASAASGLKPGSDQCELETAEPQRHSQSSRETPSQADAPPALQELVRVGSGVLEGLVNLAGENSILRARIEQGLLDFTGALEEMETTIERVREQLRRLEIETETQVLFGHETAAPGNDGFDPLEMDRHSHLRQLSRGLSESASDMLDLKETLLEKARDSESLLLQQGRINTELQEGLMRTRMVPFSHLLPRLRRIVRQISRELGKEVRFEAYNAEGELDRNLLERMVPSLEHMLRNALDHGIEETQLRRSFGKPETGRIELRLAREGGDVVIEISDDGAGIDAESVRAKAIERGVMDRDSDLPDEEVIQFVLAPGFSTARTVTQISGRGVGMDVVHSEVKQLGGSISMFSRAGKGTRFVVRLPSSVSISRALMVSVAEEAYAIPLNTIEGILLLSSEELAELTQPKDATLDYAGVPYRLNYLGQYIGREHGSFASASGGVPVVLVRAGDQAVAVLVDHVQGSREIVVKSLGPQFASVGGISGATILGDGSVVVILDLHALIRSRGASDVMDQITPSLPRSRCVMVVDDSVTVRKVTSRLLERQGMDVIVAKDGVEAVAMLQERRPDILLLDIEMPRMDGFEVTRQIRHDRRLDGLPIVMISSRTGDKHKEHASELGVNRFLGKPFQENELLSTIDELIG
ncbi:MAG: Hpt domain-containing protein [Pseudomonadales bacterium]|jgi:chemosensory pili system protein ChpA (sensor histidine kinase/response regulator)|nr:Hpt domain-containing protein [Pseudomonadales bacterium]MDP6469469.1 Hpt domain-containing protein [Pseudomonadales bacterium]MDP6827311.1 Hpt domain-containing protein [Pseudomonadales bacterium]MDP6971134.1 Hpt domain-containing protein [Pseudomonadales bacterium]